MKTCTNCTGYRSCAKLLKRLSIDPDNPNNEAIMICARYRDKNIKARKS